VQRKLGRFEIANGATIFLDEIGELPPETQAKFLRALQEGEFERVGGTQTIRVKVRVMAATNQNLEELAREGKFRSDLFYRLNVFPINIPPLRSRGNDIVLLINYFAQKYRTQFHKPLTSVSQSSIDRLREYPFPGNIRELQHLIERSVLLSEGDVLEIDLPVSRTTTNPVVADGDEVLTLDEMERRYIESVLRKTRGAIAGKGGAAELLGLPPSTLRSRMGKLGLR
jgi:transcriptional regulator with GAF, ATPase, and Fis domain